MKKVLSGLVFALVLSVPAISARTQSNNIVPANGDASKSASAEEEKKAKAKESGKPASNPKEESNEGQQTPPAATPPDTVASAPLSTSVPATGDESTAKTDSAASPQPLTGIYKVGVGDVLDIRLLNAQTRESTLFTVMPGGLLEYPLVGEPVQVAGLTTDEVDSRLTAKIKLYENPQLVVSVREYVSHNVVISGLVSNPGTKALRREAMPLYVVLAEAQPRPEAGVATIVKADGQSMTVNLTDAKATTTLIHPGDVITLSAPPPAPPQFFYIGGQVISPGQKDFHSGITLMQAVLASGGTTRFAGSKVKVSRAGADGRLTTTEYNLKQIEAGKIPDPVLQAGDRLEVGRAGW
jgi:polysaccharide export outer membrane protein